MGLGNQYLDVIGFHNHFCAVKGTDGVKSPYLDNLVLKSRAGRGNGVIGII
jgi:hypothetical protein